MCAKALLPCADNIKTQKSYILAITGKRRKKLRPIPSASWFRIPGSMVFTCCIRSSNRLRRVRNTTKRTHYRPACWELTIIFTTTNIFIWLVCAAVLRSPRNIWLSFKEMIMNFLLYINEYYIAFNITHIYIIFVGAENPRAPIRKVIMSHSHYERSPARLSLRVRSILNRWLFLTGSLASSGAENM